MSEEDQEMSEEDQRKKVTISMLVNRRIYFTCRLQLMLSIEFLFLSI
jgi:hypothetical protein